MKNKLDDKEIKHTSDSCSKARLPIRDTLDVVGGKWKLVLLTVLQAGKMGFNELAREAGISPRILSKELQDLEMNGLVSRKVCDTKPVTVQYELTEYSKTLHDVLIAMEKWGNQHRNKIFFGVE
ncbi:helix-turn-helix domain-containing protein [uncultured Algoriphagus sp.]|uniref:winged helix-turn-helix transcriptional regulator n=1 Tax=uncultured Algoriphagus sp. TaxID=417365 RepID=UPI0030EC457F|tara:strand:- start:6945 stop:7316 length:372 start_codon:yes stop_codon:yes gene_type:complete